MILGLGQRRAPVVLALVDLVQDIDVLLPVLLRGRAEGAFQLRVVVSRWLLRESPRVALLLRRHDLAFRDARRSEIIAGRAPSLSGVSAVLTASESTAEPHMAGHALAARAERLGVGAYTLQHGLENVGLTGMDEERFASGHVFCWFPPERTSAALAPETKAKLVHVGRPALHADDAPIDDDLAVFENLHAERYGEGDRKAFLARLDATLQACPDLRICVRTHPAGAWLDAEASRFEGWPNITFISGSRARADPDGAVQTVVRARRVITTPSTVALDAALAGRPTALACDGGELFAPLPVLSSADDWIDFARGRIGTDGFEAFARRNVLAGDACERILGRLKADLGAA